MTDIKELLEYRGISPCPLDIDKYWDETISETKAQNPGVEMQKVWDLPNAECFELYFTGLGGARIHARYARPKNITSPRGAVLMFHGYHASFPEWMRLLFFAGQGLCVAAMDVRGQAGKSEDNLSVSGNTVEGHIIRGAFDDDPKKLFYRYVYSDTAKLAEIVMSFDEVDKTRLYTFGGSQGAAQALACAALVPEIKKTAVHCPFLCDFKKAYELRAVAFLEIQNYFLRSDPTHQTEERLFDRLGYIDIQNLAPRISAEVKMSTGLCDTSCPALTQFAMFSKIKTEKEYILYPDFGHADYPGVFDTALRWFTEE